MIFFSEPPLPDPTQWKWTRPFWGTGCRGSPKTSAKCLSSAQAPSLCSAGIERTQKCLQGEHFVRCCSQCPQSAFQEFSGGCRWGSAAVCDPNRLRPFARYRLFQRQLISRYRRRSDLVSMTETDSCQYGPIIADTDALHILN